MKTIRTILIILILVWIIWYYIHSKWYDIYRKAEFTDFDNQCLNSWKWYAVTMYLYAMKPLFRDPEWSYVWCEKDIDDRYAEEHGLTNNNTYDK